MTISRGTRLGQYEVAAAVGAGGMGVVYRALDTKLGRDVALKVLPDAWAHDPDRLARFDREARVLASLNHTNIATIYGLAEETAAGGGEPSGKAPVRALVMELVEGPTLADRIAEGPLPLGEALAIAGQIADALESAHEHGIIHRDLKPANVKVRPDGVVKVLDFGLAKLVEPGPPASASVAGSISPTITSPALMTGLGVMVGTAAYMAPEQARGRHVDKRVDIWAFGCVLYEMMTGVRAFAADDVAGTVARVIESEPDWRALDVAAPAAIAALVRRCLHKNPRERLRDIGDARLDLEAVASRPGGVAAPVEPPAAARSRRRLRVAGVALAGVLLGAIGTSLLTALRVEPASTVPGVMPPRVLTEIDLPANAPMALDAEASNIGFDSTLIDVSPDGRTVVYVGTTSGVSRLFARQLESMDIRPLAGTDGAIHPFFAPDGSAVAFLTNDKVKVYSFATGTTTTVADATTAVTGTWTSDGQLFFASDEGRRLVRVSANGGTPEIVGQFEERVRYGRVLPNGTHALVTLMGEGISGDYASIGVVDLGTGQVTSLGVNGFDARFTSGYLVFGRSGAAFAVPFDLASRRVSGTPRPIASGVRMHALYPHLQLAAAAGVLVYATGGDVGRAGVAWVGRRGDVEFLPIEDRVYGMLDLSRDGRRLAIHVADNRDYVLIYDMARGTGYRLPAAEGAGWPKWSASGDDLAYTAFSNGRFRLVVQGVDSDRAPRTLAESTTRLTPNTWSVDGRRVSFYEFPTNRVGIAIRQADGAWSAPEYLRFPATSHDFSPDDRFFAHTPGGVNIRHWPPDERVYQVAEAGTEPRWCACGELMYRNGNRWFAAAVRTGANPQWEPPKQILQVEFNDSPGLSWAPSADGQRILVVKRREPRSRTTLHVLQGWAVP